MEATVKRTARERLLTAADELFYEEGVQSVGIDRVIERAGVAKASLYKTFGSKDELIRAYLDLRHVATTERILRGVEAQADARDRILSVFSTLGTVFVEPGFHGCAFMNANAEARPGSAAEQANRVYRAWVRGLFTDLAREAGARDPIVLARQLHMIYDGVGHGADVEHDPSLAADARAAAALLVEAATTSAPHKENEHHASVR